MIEFKVLNVGKAEAWCMKHIGPRLYYIHDRIGGEGWRIMRRGDGVLLCLEDDRQATMAMLTLSGQ
jgi:hypothetical protein